MEKITKAYRWFKSYIRFVTLKVFYRKGYVEGLENLPPSGTPVLIVSNHQNSFNDALNVLLAINDRKPHFIVRGDVFAFSPIADRFLRSLGLLPAYRLEYEGEEALAGNDATFGESEQYLLDGSTTLVFPEAGHSEGHWLSVFKGGLTKLAFEAAQKANFEKDILLVPSCNHYSSYKGLRTEYLVRFSEPISLKDFYELYQTKPRTACRQVNALLHERIHAMMLDIRDREHYDQIEFIRNSEYGSLFARKNGYDPELLPQKLDSDKKMVSLMWDGLQKESPYCQDIRSEQGQSAGELSMIARQKRLAAEAKAKESLEEVPVPESTPLLDAFEKADLICQKERESGIVDRQFAENPTKVDLAVRALCLLILLPVAVFCLWPSLVCWFVPKLFAGKAKGDMFEGTFLVILNVLFIFPVSALATAIFVWVKASFLSALLYVLLIPAICLFEWAYYKWAKEFFEDCRWISAVKKGFAGEIGQLRKAMFSNLDEFFNQV